MKAQDMKVFKILGGGILFVIFIAFSFLMFLLFIFEILPRLFSALVDAIT